MRDYPSLDYMDRVFIGNPVSLTNARICGFHYSLILALETEFAGMYIHSAIEGIVLPPDNYVSLLCVWWTLMSLLFSEHATREA